MGQRGLTQLIRNGLIFYKDVNLISAVYIRTPLINDLISSVWTLRLCLNLVKLVTPNLLDSSKREREKSKPPRGLLLPPELVETKEEIIE